MHLFVRNAVSHPSAAARGAPCIPLDWSVRVIGHSATAYHPAVTAPIIGARTVAQLEQGLAAVALARQLSADERAEITKLAEAA